MLGKSVTVIEALPRLMSRVVAPAISDFFAEFHESKGVKVLCNTSVAEIIGTNRKASSVTTKDGKKYDADLVLVGIGVAPNTDLAQAAGLPVSNGVQVNAFLGTQNEDIFAIGDCAEHPCMFTDARVRLESVQNAADQAHCVAATIAGHKETYRALPWFWTDQFDVKLQMAGISHGHDRIVTRGNREAKKLSVFYFKRDRLTAVDSINRPLDHMIGRKLIAAGAAVTPEQAADDSFDLKTLAQRSKST
jgi:3-phenylpropionate/trans-cinnamate dioxygenase ferredoxin reductase subunit